MMTLMIDADDDDDDDISILMELRYLFSGMLILLDEGKENLTSWFITAADGAYTLANSLVLRKMGRTLQAAFASGRREGR